LRGVEIVTIKRVNDQRTHRTLLYSASRSAD
jgi:hypothetical protein